MSDENQVPLPGVVPENAPLPESSGALEAGTPAVVEDVGAQEGAENGLGFDERFVQEPDWGLQKFKRVQADATRASQKLKSAEQAIQIAETLGQGDLETGSAAMMQYLQNYGRIQGNPEMAKIMEEYLQTGITPTRGEVAQAANALPDDDPFADPSVKEIAELKQQVAKLSGAFQQSQSTLAQIQYSSSETVLHKNLDKFFGDYPLDESEKAEVLGKLSQQMRAWTPAQTANYGLVRAAALNYLSDDRIGEISLRRAQQRQQERAGIATDAAPSVRSTGQEATTGTDINRQIERYANSLGVDMSKPLSQQ